MEVRSKAIYDSCKMFSPSGELMCFISNRKAKWYLTRNLARKIADNPIAIVLEFEPKAPGHVGDKFYTTARQNHCVACGKLESLTLHHIVPYCYRRYFPEIIKSHSSHDLVPLCLTCHNFYEIQAWKLKEIIADEYNVPWNSNGESYTLADSINAVHKAARALNRHLAGEIKLPETRRTSLQSLLSKYLNKEYCDTSIEEALKIEYCSPNAIKHDNCSKLIVAKVNIQEFVQRWRQHFVDTIAPRFMPEAWSITRKMGENQ